jgi:predicted Ser/Thr protein kinase
MHDTPPPTSSPHAVAGRSSVVPLAAAGGPPPLGTTDHVPTVLGENPLARPAPVAFDLPVGSALGHFEVTGPLGAGGMATVFKAKDLTLGREVALKILPPQLAADPDAVSRFKFEARAAAKLNHDHVARVYFIGEDRGLHFIAFEFVDGRTLRDLIDAHGPITTTEAVRYLLDTAVGLQHAAEKGVVHRDVKPSNIIVTPAGRAKLIDMGLARSVEPHSVNGQVTQSGMTLGTFDYISPEQAIDPRRADVRSDIYSLGCTFYHALTGRTPVPDGNAARKLAAHQTESPTDPRLINPSIPDDLAAILDRMMAKQPAHRHQSAGELIADLTRLATAIGVVSAAREPTAQPLIAPSAVGRGRAAVLSVGVAGVAVAFAVVMLVAASNGGQHGTAPPLPWAELPAKTTPPVEPPPSDPAPPPVPTQTTVATAAELLKAIKDGVPKVTLTPGVYDLSAEAGAVVSSRGAVDWECLADGGAVLKLTAVARGERPTDPRPGTLTFHNCPSVKLKGLRVEFSPTDTPRPVGIWFHDVGSVDVTDCRFTVPGGGAMDGALLAFSRTAGLSVRHGFFASKGAAGVELPAGVKAEFTECGFIAGRAAIEVAPTAEPTPAGVTTSHVTFQLNNTAAAVNVGKGARCELTAAYTLFAGPAEPGMMPNLDPQAVVFRAADSPDTNVFSIPETAVSAVYRVDPPTAGATAAVLTVSPWATAPRADGDPFAALELNPKLPPLRVGKSDILGVREWNDRRKVYPPLPPLVRPGEVVWHPKLDPAEKELYPENVYADLKEALAALKGKGTVLVRGRGTIPMPTVVLDADRTITMKADEDSAPILTPAAANDRRETTLFRLEAGELRLERLHFHVKPGRSADAASVVAMTGGRKCELKQCVVTVDEPNKDIDRTAVVSLADVAKFMAKKEFADPTVLTFENCLVRGRGRVVRAETAVSASVTLSHVGILTDSAAAFDFGPPSRTAAVHLHLSHVTAAVGGPLFEVWDARRPDVQADDCLFAAVDSSTEPLVRASGVDVTADRSLTWTTAGGNAYGGWVTFAELTADDATDPKRWDASDWRRWGGEADTPAVTLKRSPASKAAARPTDLEPSDPTTAGASLKALAGLFPD